VNRQILWTWLFLFFVSWPLIAQKDCGELVAKVVSEQTQVSEPNFSSWRITNRDLKLTPRHLLPKNFLDEIEAKVGTVPYTKDRPINELAPSHSTFYVQRPLPLRFRPGYQLTPSDIVEIQTLLQKRDSWIEQYQKQELARSAESNI
jgi:hypothetical protein